MKQLANHYEAKKTWRDEARVLLKEIKMEAKKVKDLNPPKGLIEVHELYLQAFKEYDIGAKDMITDLGLLDKPKVTEAIELIRKGNETFVRGTE